MISKTKRKIRDFAMVLAAFGWLHQAVALGSEPGLVGHWKLHGDCRDSSGHGNNGVNHGVDLDHGAFDGEQAYIEVPASESLKLGKGDFAICAWINTEKELDDIVGDVVDMYDPAQRRGITLTINSSAGGYQSQGTDRHVHFGIDNARMTDWQDCGHPNPASNYVFNSLTVYKGKLYAATSGGKDEKDWRHVYRYDGGQDWTDCGQVGDGKVEGVGPLIVHNGDLYAVDNDNRLDPRDKPAATIPVVSIATWVARNGKTAASPARIALSTASPVTRESCMSGAVRKSYGVFVTREVSEWQPSKVFSNRENCHAECFPHAMCRHNGKLFVAYPGAYAFDGKTWTFAGETLPPDQDWFLQTHSMTIFQGKAPRRNVARKQSVILSRWRKLEGARPRGRRRHRGATHWLSTTASFTAVHCLSPKFVGMTASSNGPR